MILYTLGGMTLNIVALECSNRATLCRYPTGCDEPVVGKIVVSLTVVVIGGGGRFEEHC